MSVIMLHLNKQFTFTELQHYLPVFLFLIKKTVTKSVIKVCFLAIYCLGFIRHLVTFHTSIYFSTCGYTYLYENSFCLTSLSTSYSASLNAALTLCILMSNLISKRLYQNLFAILS